MSPERAHPEGVNPNDNGSALVERPPGSQPALDPTAITIVRPLVCLCYPSVARLATGIAGSFLTNPVEAPILGQAVLRDLAWLCEYLRETADHFLDLEPAREALLDFLHETAPEKAPEWLEVRVPDEPLRWAFRVQRPRDLGDMMTRLVRSAVAANELLHLDRPAPYNFACAVFTSMGELELAQCDAPPWKPELRKIHRLAAQTLNFEASG